MDDKIIAFLKNTFTASVINHLRNLALIILIAVILGGVMHSVGFKGDRSGYATIVAGFIVFAAPLCCAAGALSFVFNRTVLGDIFSALCLFVTVFGGTILFLT